MLPNRKHQLMKGLIEMSIFICSQISVMLR
jgi:hypothetical protein